MTQVRANTGHVLQGRDRLQGRMTSRLKVFIPPAHLPLSGLGVAVVNAQNVEPTVFTAVRRAVGTGAHSQPVSTPGTPAPHTETLLLRH